MNVLRDSPIGFPGLFGDWQFTVSSTAFHLGQHPIYWYGILLAAGVIAGLILCSKQAKRFGLKEENVLDLVLWGVPIGILGARIYYVVFYLKLFRKEGGGLDWGKAVAVWDGGLAIYGAVIAVFIMAFVYCRHKKIKMAAMTDLCVMGLLLGQAIGRWGNFMNREAFGGITTLPWRMQLWTSATQYIQVHPTFLYESLWNLIGLLLLLFIVTPRRRFDGENTWCYFLWYGLGRSWIEGMRTDSLYLFDWQLFGQPIRVSQALSVVMVVVSAFMLFYRIKVQKRSPEDLMINQMERSAAAASAEQGETAAPVAETTAAEEEEMTHGSENGREGPGGEDQGADR